MPAFSKKWVGHRSAIVLVATYAFSMLVVLRAWLTSGFDLGFSDRADGIIEISILEHWRDVFHGWSSWNRSFYFHPYGDTLGYNDGYFLYGIVYTILRTMFDPFTSDMLNITVFKTIGFFGAYALAKGSLGLGRVTALAIASLFTISCGLMAQAGHAQLQTIGLLPVLGVLAIRIVRLTAEGRPRHAYPSCVGMAALLAGWFLTTFYMAWFTLFFAALFGACWLIVAPSPGGRLAQIARLARQFGPAAALFAASFVLYMVPFLIVYLPKLSETGGHGFVEISYYLVQPYDLTNVGRGNYAWGWLYRGLYGLMQSLGQSAESKLGDEHVSGFPLLLFAAIVASAFRALRPREAGRIDPVLRAFALAIVIGWACTIHVRWFSLWRLVYLLVPGAHGLRVVLRFQLFLILPVLLLIALVQKDRIRQAIRYRPILAAAAIALLVAEQLGAVERAQLSRASQLELAALPAPPQGCASFYVVKARRAEPPFRDAAIDSLYPHNVDAMLLAELWRVPTINGYSTFNPPDWNFASPTAPDYDRRVLRYALAHGIRHLCRLDARNSRPWRRMAT